MIYKYLLCGITAIFMLFIEVWLLYICFFKKYLYQKKLTFSRFKTQVKEFYNYMRKLNQNKVTCSNTLNKFLEEKKDKYENFRSAIIHLGIMLFLYAITCSIFFVMVLFYIPKYSIIFSLVVLAIELSLFHGLCQKYNNQFIECLDEFTLFLFQFRRMIKNGKNREINTVNNIYNTIITWGALIFSIAIVIILLLVFKKLTLDWKNIFDIDYIQNPILITAIVSIIGAFTVFLYVKEKKVLKSKNEIIYDAKLKPWENDIEKICKKLHIKNVEIKVVHDIASETVTSTFKKYETPQICIGAYFLDNLNINYKSDIFYNMVLFILGHELSHISSKDSFNTDRFMFLLFLFFGYIIFWLIFRRINIFLYSIIGFQSLLMIISLLMMVFTLFLIFVYRKTWTDERYWRQVYELRG